MSIGSPRLKRSDRQIEDRGRLSFRQKRVIVGVAKYWLHEYRSTL